VGNADIYRIKDVAESKAKQRFKRTKKNRYQAIRLSEMSLKSRRQSAEACRDENN